MKLPVRVFEPKPSHISLPPIHVHSIIHIIDAVLLPDEVGIEQEVEGPPPMDDMGGNETMVGDMDGEMMDGNMTDTGDMGGNITDTGDMEGMDGEMMTNTTDPDADVDVVASGQEEVDEDEDEDED